jgi:hypothetical protein
MGRNAHKLIPLEIRWRVPASLPGPGEVAEIAFVRWLDDHSRVTVGRVRVPVSSPGVLHGVTEYRQAEGWVVAINGEAQHAEPLSFLDACYNGYAAFVEAVPTLAVTMAKTLAAQARYEGWPEDEMDVHIVEEDTSGPGHTAAETDAPAAPVG